MGFRAFGNCLNETVIRPKGGWALAPFFSGGFWNREREGRFCRYTSLSAQDLEWIVVVLCVGRDDRAGQIGVDAALEEGARALKQYVLSPGRDPYPLLNRMAASWRQKVEEADWRQNLRLLERYGYTPFAPDFLAVVGTGRETFFVRYGEGCFFYKADGRLQEKTLDFGAGGAGVNGFAEGREPIFCRRVPGRAEAVFLIAGVEEGLPEKMLDRFLHRAARLRLISRGETEDLLEVTRTDWEDEAVFAAAGFRTAEPKRESRPPARPRIPAGKPEKYLKQKAEELQRLQHQLRQAEQEKEQLEAQGNRIREQLGRLEEDYEKVKRRLGKNEAYLQRKAERSGAGEKG